MADDTEPGSGNGNGHRATVALVDAKIDTIRAIVEGGFENVHSRLDRFESLPAQVSAQHEMVMLLQARVTIIEKEGISATRQLSEDLKELRGAVKRIEDSDAMQMDEKQRRRLWKANNLPAYILSGAALVVSVLLALFT